MDSDKLEEGEDTWRYFATYSGVRLPLRLVTPIEAAALSNRNTFIRARFDDAGRLLECEKLVYGEVELIHRYEYDADGVLRQAEITMLDEETRVLQFDGDAARAGEGTI